MSQCNLHFDDSTAHATVEWFLPQLSLKESSVIGKALSIHDSSHPDAENDRNHLEALCRDLNAVRFIDCLREQVKEDDNHFGRIKDIAKRLEVGREWKKFPNLFILLFSIVQRVSDESVKETELYSIAEDLYEHFKKLDDFPDDRAFVFKVGFQLSRFQKNNESWQKEFAEFKTLYYKELGKLRWKYYSVDNPAEYSHRVIVRWKRMISDSTDHESEGLNPEFKELTQEFYALDPRSAVLHPMSLELPILARSTEALKFADDFVHKLNDGLTDNEILAKEFRIVQWDVLVRNLVEESLEGILCFHPVTEEREVKGTPDLDSFIIPFIEKARNVEQHFIPSDGEIPKKRENNDILSSAIFFFDNKEVENCHNSFRRLLPKVPDYYPDVYKDLVRSFANMHSSGESANAMLIEDGELSFFSLLWLLRYAVSKDKQTTEWHSNPEELLPVRFRPSEGKSPNSWWFLCDMYEFAEELGLIIRLTEEKCVLTRRWRSLVAWLRQLNNDLRALPVDANAKELEQKLPVKTLGYKEEKSFIEELGKFFASDNLTKYFDRELNIFLSDVFVSCTDFASEFGCLVELLDPLMKVKSSTGLEDKVLLRCCRAGFIPLEHLFRAYQPYELHLLIQALNWEETSIEGWTKAPISLGFATIAGQVEPHHNSMINSGSSHEETVDFRHWLVPYRSFFSALSSGITLPAVQKSSEQIGEQTGTRTQKQYFAHQTSGLLDTVWEDEERGQLGFESQFALWMVRTHVTDIWGGFSLSTEQPIYREPGFAHWQEFDEKKVVLKLVYLGLQGGIRRALKSDTPSVVRPAQGLFKQLRLAGDDTKKVEQILDRVLKSLLCHLPEGIAPPNWVATKAFAICFYHAMRQASYHALKTSIVDHQQKGKSCLQVSWDNQSVSIYNRGKVDKKHLLSNFVAKDREFFKLFVGNTGAFCDQRGIVEKFKIDGPEPSKNNTNTWQLVIRRGK